MPRKEKTQISVKHDCPSPAKVTELENSRLWIQQQILGFDVPMADTKRVNVGQAPEELVHIQLHRKTHTQIHTQRLEKQQTSIIALKYRNSGLYFSSREWVLQQMFRLQFHTLFLLTPKHCHSAFVEIKLSIWSVFIDTHVLKWKQIFKSKLISCFKFAASGQSILTNKIKKCFTC